MAGKKEHSLSVDPVLPDAQAIAWAAGRIRDGGVVVFPTSTFYGLGANACDSDVVSEIFRIKKRAPRKPILILIASPTALSSLVRKIPPPAALLMDAFWPGRVTLVFEGRAVLPENLTGGTGKIGIRLAAHPVSQALVRACGFPITATSANVAGKGGCARIEELDRHISRSVDGVLDAGPLPGTAGSSVVDVTVTPPRILREGVVPAEMLRSVCGAVS